MRLKLLTPGLLLMAGTFHAQEVVWARQYNYFSNNNDPSKIAVSPANDLAVAGIFYDNSQSLGGHFLMKLDSSGNVMWMDTLYTHSAASNALETGGLAFETSGTPSLYMSANFTDTLQTSAGSFGAPGHNSVLFNYDGSGNIVLNEFVKNAWFSDLWVTPTNDLMVLLSFADSLHFFGQNFYAKGETDLLFGRVSATGSLLFADQISGTELRGVGIRADATGIISVLFIRIGQGDTISYRDSVLYDDYGSDHQALLLKTQGNGQFLAFTEVRSHVEFGSADADISINGNFISALEGVFKSTNTRLQVFDTSGDEVSNCGRSAVWHGGSDYRTADYARVAAAGTNAYWCLGYEEAPGDIHDPADDKRFMFLEKIDYQCNSSRIDSFAHTDISAACDIATHFSGDVFITGEIPINQSIRLGNTVLTNSDDYNLHNTIFVARFADKQKSVGIGDQKEPLTLKCYPNPSAGIFELSVDPELAGSAYTVYSSTGQSVGMGILGPGQTTIDLSQMPAGVYMINVGKNSARRTARLIIR